jgi:hypothetical protein
VSRVIAYTFHAAAFGLQKYLLHVEISETCYVFVVDQKIPCRSQVSKFDSILSFHQNADENSYHVTFVWAEIPLNARKDLNTFSPCLNWVESIPKYNKLVNRHGRRCSFKQFHLQFIKACKLNLLSKDKFACLSSLFRFGCAFNSVSWSRMYQHADSQSPPTVRGI